jgi:Uma2 family endonuclease
MFAVEGGRYEHNLISLNIGDELRDQTRELACQILSSNMRLPIEAAGLFTYPDVSVVRGEPRFADKRQDIPLNPL